MVTCLPDVSVCCHLAGVHPRGWGGAETNEPVHQHSEPTGLPLQKCSSRGEDRFPDAGPEEGGWAPRVGEPAGQTGQEGWGLQPPTVPHRSCRGVSFSFLS